jgi:Flp pilus assembly protein TadB
VETCIIQWNVLLSVYSWMVVRRRTVQRLEANFPTVLFFVVGKLSCHTWRP